MRRTVVLLASMALAVFLACGVALAATISCPNRVGGLCVGTDNRDFMNGTSARDIMRGLGAADTLRARAGADRLTGGNGDDKLGGGRGSDVYAFRNEWGRDLITSRETSGVDTLDFTGLDRDFVFVNLIGGQFYAEVYASHGNGKTASINFPFEAVLENVRGTPQGDYIFGNNNRHTGFGVATSNHFWGYPGGDLLVGGEGNDILDGGAGKDDLYSYGYIEGDDGSDSTLTGGSGTDFLYGEDGDDTIHAIDGEADTITCGDGIDTVHYDQGLDTFYSSTTPDGSTTPDASCETTLTT